MSKNNLNIRVMKINNLNLTFMKTNFLNFTNMKTIKLIAMSMMAILFFTACDDDDPEPVNENELITDVVLTFTNDADNSDTVILTNNAPDGQDGAFTNDIQGSFTAGATYSLTLQILNSTETPAEDVLVADIVPEADEHFFKYAVDGINLTMTRDANDEDGAGGSKLGLRTTWVAVAASTGNIRIQLIHEPVTTDDADNFGLTTGGSDDLNITFENVTIQ